MMNFIFLITYVLFLVKNCLKVQLGHARPVIIECGGVFLAELGEPVKVTGTDDEVVRLVLGVLLYL